MTDWSSTMTNCAVAKDTSAHRRAISCPFHLLAEAPNSVTITARSSRRVDSVKNVESLPPLTDDVILVADALRRGLDRSLGDAVASLFLYGAVAFPRPDRWKIDFDFHVLLHRSLTDAERERIGALYTELAAVSELGADLDGYFLLLVDATGSEPPRHQLRLAMRDDAWALHRAHVHAGRYFLIAGVDPIEVVPEPTWPEIEAGLQAEMDFVVSHPDATAFGILNAARILYSCTTRDAVLSKYQAAEWALVTLPPEWHRAIGAAQRWYAQRPEDGDDQLLSDERERFVDYVRRSLPPA